MIQSFSVSFTDLNIDDKLGVVFISLLNFGFHVEFRMKIYPLQNLKHKQGMKGRVQVQVRKKRYNLVRFGLERERKQRINLEFGGKKKERGYEKNS